MGLRRGDWGRFLEGLLGSRSDWRVGFSSSTRCVDVNRDRACWVGVILKYIIISLSCSRVEEENHR